MLVLRLNWHALLGVICFIFRVTSVYSLSEAEYNVTWLRTGVNHTGPGNNEIAIFCHCGDNKSVISLWRSAYVEIKGATDFTLFEGSNGSEVIQQYKSHLSSWIPFSPWRYNQVSLPVFDNHCLGVTSSTTYKVQLIIRNINYWLLLRTIVGGVLFFSAPTICRNSFFYYTSGISVGVFASILVLLFLISRLVPKKSAVSYSVLIFGGSFAIYVFQKLWFNIKVILLNYSTYVIGYILVSAFVSFSICYKYQPMSDVRSKNIIQWVFQFIGLVMVFYSSEFQEVSLALVVVFLVSYCIPDPWKAKFKTWWKRRFPPKIKLLTELEYMEQTNRETKKAIAELRRFCDSPDCKSWKYVSRLKNPLRFAKFVEGDSHLMDDEILKYDSDSVDPARTEDLDDEDMDVEMTDDEN